MRFGLAQFDCVVGDRSANLATARRFANDAKQKKCDVLILPEIFDMGYVLTRVAAESATTEPQPIPELQKIAKETKLTIVAGIADAREGRVYNSIVTVNPQGETISSYDKTHLVTAAPMHEEQHLAAGKEFVVTKIGDLTCGFMTCYDVRFPEVARSLMLQGAQVIILPAAFPLVRLAHWEVLPIARAIENQSYVLACNRIGEDGPGLVFCGTSMAIDPYGKILAKGSTKDEELLLVDVSANVVEETRQKMKVLQDRRPELYKELTKE